MKSWFEVFMLEFGKINVIGLGVVWGNWLCHSLRQMGVGF